MYGHYEYGSQHTVGGSSSEPNPFVSSSQPNFLDSFREEQSPIEEMEEIHVPVTQKKPKRRRQTVPKKKPHKEKAEDQYSVKGNARKERGFWVDILKYMHETCPITKRQTYNMVNRKWKTVRPKVASFCGVYANTILTYTSGAGDADYLQRAMTDYGVEYRVPFTLLHCWEVLKDCDKLNSREVPLFMQERKKKKNKRYKSSGSSSTKQRG
ncbi:hypothetical protein Tco_1387660 [Tanacetum coccineum]